MSPRPADPHARLALIDTAARLLAVEGPQALTTRRLSTETGTSTMAVYTYFGGMGGLVRQVVHEGFERLQQAFDAVHTTPDPVADLALLGRAYRHNAVTNPHLFAVMFGGSSLGGFALSEEDRQIGRHTLGPVVEHTARCIERGRFTAADPVLVAHQMWLAVHGLVTLELGHYLIEPWTAERCFEAQLVAVMLGAGDATVVAKDSVAASRRRFHRAVSAAAVRSSNPSGRLASGATVRERSPSRTPPGGPP